MRAYNYQIIIFNCKYCLFFNEIYILPRFQTIEMKCCGDFFHKDSRSSLLCLEYKKDSQSFEIVNPTGFYNLSG